MNSGSDQITRRGPRQALSDFLPPSVVDLGPFASGDRDLFAEQRLEWLFELPADVLGVVDVDLLEDGLVELSSHNGAGFEVGGVPVRGEGERVVEVGFDLAEPRGLRF